ncbi:uncharacterized protein SOCE836_043490 [Sorangium cellulosum]|uniref:Uncharacterized protein n=1 Tax=Sorangium cellulosum TaxID=56 RepID=A0A4V0NG77_SORCE|nr:uncharacterized protein SOCE836_043490 [Sorangium cellulosum]WCQ91584.1 hypothetical protein NQZ70_04306 [Sorangium sp. Soce836]
MRRRAAGRRSRDGGRQQQGGGTVQARSLCAQDRIRARTLTSRPQGDARRTLRPGSFTSRSRCDPSAARVAGLAAERRAFQQRERPQGRKRRNGTEMELYSPLHLASLAPLRSSSMNRFSPNFSGRLSRLASAALAAILCSRGGSWGWIPSKRSNRGGRSPLRPLLASAVPCEHTPLQTSAHGRSVRRPSHREHRAIRASHRGDPGDTPSLNSASGFTAPRARALRTSRAARAQRRPAAGRSPWPAPRGRPDRAGNTAPRRPPRRRAPRRR